MCLEMANGGKSLTEDLRKKSASEAIKSFQEAGTRFTSGMIESGLNTMYEAIHRFQVEVVEKQESLIMQTVQQIGGEMYSNITIDKNKVLDAFRKQIPKKPIEKDSTDYWGNIIDTVFICSECNRFICYGVETQPEKDYPYCHCGQKIDWSDTDE